MTASSCGTLPARSRQVDFVIVSGVQEIILFRRRRTRLEKRLHGPCRVERLAQNENLHQARRIDENGDAGGSRAEWRAA